MTGPGPGPRGLEPDAAAGGTPASGPVSLKLPASSCPTARTPGGPRATGTQCAVAAVTAALNGPLQVASLSTVTGPSAGTPTRRKAAPDSENESQSGPAPPKGPHWQARQRQGPLQAVAQPPAGSLANMTQPPGANSPPRAGQARPQPGAPPTGGSNRAATSATLPGGPRLATRKIPPLSPTVMRWNIVDRALGFWSHLLLNKNPIQEKNVLACFMGL